ncbi:LysR family transcriptional regulator [Nocardia brevicatena]|uniref:LysR family transcriptional regulator n=1 Tax=Nocardia brevicatena TaxID=37327 RepID=UPI0002F4B76D|nr:LysR family transcriptional regulator [Nocardia brevicatena]
MELRHIHVFLALADELHFGRAATRLNVVQSSVSQTIKALEEEIGAPLFARTRRKVALTPAGQQFLEHARHALKSLDHAANAARKAADGQTGRLVLGFTLLTALTPVPDALALFHRTYPGVELSIEHGTSAENITALAAGRCDLAFVTRRDDTTAFACAAVTEEPLTALVAAGHRFADRRSLTFADLRGEPRIVLSRRAEPELHAKYYADNTNIVLEADQIDTMLALVATGIGIACAPRSVTRLQLPGVVTVPIDPPELAGISVIWDPATLSTPAQRFLEILRKADHAETTTGIQGGRGRSHGDHRCDLSSPPAGSAKADPFSVRKKGSL